MKVLREGHRYELASFEGSAPQTIQFIEKVPRTGSTDLETISDGTTNEEMLSVLIDRLSNLNAKFPCRENSIAITKCQEALLWLNQRTRDRMSRGVEGKQIA